MLALSSVTLGLNVQPKFTAPAALAAMAPLPALAVAAIADIVHPSM